jgi:hypothetical protein
MAQAGYTPIQLYYSTTAAAVPTSGNLASGELAINITDGKLYYKSNAGVVTLLAGATAGPAGGSNTQVQFNSSGILAGSANMTFNGTTLTAGGLTTTGITSTGVLSVTGNTTLGDAAADTLTINSTITSNLIFTDNTYDIGASGATRPRNLFVAGNATIGGLTTGRVVYTATNGILSSSGNLTYAGTDLANSNGDIIIGNNPSVTTRMFRAIEVGSTGNNAGIAFGTAGAKGAIYGQSGVGGLSIVSGTSGAIAFGYSTGSADASANFLSLGAWTTNGLGVGTSSPAGNLQISGSGDRSLLVTGGTAGTVSVQLGDSGAAGQGGMSYDNSVDALFFKSNGSERARIASNGNFGIGTTGPVTQLQVNSGSSYVGGFKSTVANGFVAFQDSGTSGALTDGNVAIGAISNDLAFRSGGATRMRLDASGNLGIAITPSSYTLDVNGTTFLRSTTNIYSSTGGAVNSSFLTFGSAALLSAASIYSKTDTSTAGNLVFATAQSGTGTMTERGRFDAEGNFGVGNTSPPTGVRVTSKAPSASGYNLFLEQNNGLDGYLLACTSNDGDLVFSRRDTSGATTTEKARLTSGGFLLVGTTVNTNSYYAVVLNDIAIRTATDASGSTNLRLGVSSSMPQGIATLNGTKTAVGGGDMIFNTATGGVLAERMRLTGAGYFGINTTSPNFYAHISTGLTTSITQPTAGSYGLYIQQNTSGSTGGIYIQDGASNSGSSLVIADNNGAVRFNVDSDGNVIIGTGAENGQFTVRNASASKATGGFLATNTSGPNFCIDAVSYATAANTTALMRGFSGTGTPSIVFNLNGFGNISQFGGQITFPATQSASANANTLDDYEEGTWTPVLTDGTNNVASYYYQYGSYIKVGRLVTINCTISVNNKGSLGSGDVYISGLPFTSGLLNNSFEQQVLAAKIFPLGSDKYGIGTIDTSVTILRAVTVTSGGQNAVQGGNVTGGSQLFFTGTYWSAS